MSHIGEGRNIAGNENVNRDIQQRVLRFYLLFLRCHRQSRNQLQSSLLHLLIAIPTILILWVKKGVSRGKMPVVGVDSKGRVLIPKEL